MLLYRCLVWCRCWLKIRNNSCINRWLKFSPPVNEIIWLALICTSIYSLYDNLDSQNRRHNSKFERETPKKEGMQWISPTFERVWSDDYWFIRSYSGKLVLDNCQRVGLLWEYTNSVQIRSPRKKYLYNFYNIKWEKFSVWFQSVVKRGCYAFDITCFPKQRTKM